MSSSGEAGQQVSAVVKLQIKQEQYATDVGGYFPVWNVYRDNRQVAMCFSADDAREVYEGLLCWAQVQYEAAERSGGDGRGLPIA